LNLNFRVLLAQGDAAPTGASLILVAIWIPAFRHRHSRLPTLERRRAAAAAEDDDEDDSEVAMTCCDAEDPAVASSVVAVA